MEDKMVLHHSWRLLLAGTEARRPARSRQQTWNLVPPN
jgi:hypothetical protein